LTARSFVYDGVRQISVVNFRHGSLVVEPGPAEGSVEGTLSTTDEATLGSIVLRQDHDHLRIEIRPVGARGTDVHLRLGVPAGLDYAIAAGSADVHIGADAGRVRVSTASGDVTLGRLRELVCRVASGNVAVDDVEPGPVDVSTGSGDIAIQRVAGGPIRAKSGSGGIRVVILEHAELHAGTGSGDIAVPMASGAVDVRSASGSVTVGVADELPAWLDLQSASGQVRMALQPSAEPAPGEPYVTVRARTASGDIAVYRA
jgi:DUF4097 and DUF4098 domain-containing protein YvlB